MYDFSQSPLLSNQSFYNGKQTLQRRIVYLFLLLAGASLLSAIASTFYMLFAYGSEFLGACVDFINGAITENAFAEITEEITLAAASQPGAMLLSLFCTAFTVVAVLVFALVIEGRRPVSLGLAWCRKSSVYECLLGLALGVLMILATVGGCILTGAISIVKGSTSLAWVLAFFLAFIMQSFSEELLFRGYFMTALLRWRQNPWWAVLISSFVFALMHGGNYGMNFLGFINIFLFGISTALLTLRTGSLWCATALHAIWNFLQGNVFGISVSGSSLLPSVFKTVLAEGRDFTHGGLFGLEGGCITTIVLLVTLVAAIYIPRLKPQRPEILDQ